MLWVRSPRATCAYSWTSRDLPADAFTAHQAGWEHYLGRLATCAAGGGPGPDPLRVG